MKILILKPSSLGDVVQALPVLRLLKRQLPRSEIYWWIESKLAPLLEGDPDLRGIVRFERHRWAAPRHWGELASSIRFVRHQEFDWVIDLQCLARSGAFAWAANGKLTVGLDEPREGARAFYDLIAHTSRQRMHAVDRYLAILPLLRIPVDWNFEWLPIRKPAKESIREKWPAAEDTQWLSILPGARWQNKRWPVEAFAELVRQAAGQWPELRFAVLGSAEDQDLGARIRQAVPERCLDLTGRISLTEMVEWIRLSRLVVSNDTGPMHVAAALGRPVVALFGPTAPHRTGPYGQLDHVLQLNLPCVPCLSARCHYAKPMECLRALSPGAVFEAVKHRLCP